MIGVTFNSSSLLQMGITIALVAAGWGKLFSQVRELEKWQKDRSKADTEIRDMVLKQIEICEQFDKQLDLLESDFKLAQREPVELVMRRYYSQMEADFRRLFVDKDVIKLQLDQITVSLQQMDKKITSDTQDARNFFEKVLQQVLRSHGQMSD